MADGSKYLELGVDVRKSGVEFFKRLVEEVYPHAFASIIKDDRFGEGLILHVDGAGSKPVISYLYFRETGDVRWFRGLAQDVVAMNVDDVVTVGAEPILFADYIAINPLNLPRLEVLKELSVGFKEVLNFLSTSSCNLSRKFRLLFAGGETADLPDQVRTLDVVGVVFATVDLSKAISGDGVAAGDVIVGLRSGGRAKFEKFENSGIMCNGLTLARHSLLTGEYALRYPEVCEPSSDRKYYGRFRVDDYLDELRMTVGEALLSPTRIYAPIIAEVLEKCGSAVKGLVHNTGGGLTKILRVGLNVRYVKDSLPPPDPIFLLIQREGKVGWREMYEVFNMGVGFEFIVDRECAEDVISICDRFGVDAYIIGRVEKGVAQYNELIIRSDYGDFAYRRRLKV